MSLLMRQIREFQVPKNFVALWWFGQNGYIFKSPEGTLASVDLYLTDSCAGNPHGLDLHRRVPVFIEPEDLDVDIFTCTHNHPDHTDRETIALMARSKLPACASSNQTEVCTTRRLDSMLRFSLSMAATASAAIW